MTELRNTTYNALNIRGLKELQKKMITEPSPDHSRLRAVHSRKVGNTWLKDSTDYCGSLILQNGAPSMYQFAGGYISFSNSALSGCHYYIQDYLGNNRMVVNKTDAVEQTTHYYPYGGVIGGIALNSGFQKYKFGGKELDRSYGLDWYDVQARQYDPVVPSWHTIDPLAEKYYNISPYAYCAGNPVIFVDPKGMEKINALDPNNENNKDRIKAVENFSDEKDVVNIWAHGSENGMTVYNKEDGTTSQIRDAKSFANFLDMNSNVWKNRNESQNVIIVLHSCETGLVGKNGESFAQKLSDGLDNVTIIAPTDNVYIAHGKELGTYKSSVEQNKTADGKTVLSSGYLGRWVQYENGQQTQTYKGNTHPGEKGYNIITSQSSMWDKFKHTMSNLF